jgi:hypothetical protein
VAEGARLESVFRGNSNVGSNPTLSAIMKSITYKNYAIVAAIAYPGHEVCNSTVLKGFEAGLHLNLARSRGSGEQWDSDLALFKFARTELFRMTCFAVRPMSSKEVDCHARVIKTDCPMRQLNQGNDRHGDIFAGGVRGDFGQSLAGIPVP